MSVKDKAKEHITAAGLILKTQFHIYCTIAVCEDENGHPMVLIEHLGREDQLCGLLKFTHAKMHEEKAKEENRPTIEEAAAIEIMESILRNTEFDHKQ